MDNHLLVGRFRLREMIGEGGFGQIYEAEDTRLHINVAVKIEPTNIPNSQLEIEAKMYEIFHDSTCVPKMYFYGTDRDKNLLAIDMLHKPIERLLAENKRKLSLKTVLLLADQMIDCIRYIHSKDFIHRDIKPENFMTGTGANSGKIYIIDFGLCKRYRNQYNKQHIAYSEGKALTGTARYASINAMAGGEQSRRDDMESLGYVLIYLLKGELPWMDQKSENVEEKFSKVLQKKKNTKISDLVKGIPEEFGEYLIMVRQLLFHQEPEYDKYKQMFKDLYERSGFPDDHKFDWTEEEPEQKQKQASTSGYHRKKPVRKPVQVEELLAMKTNAVVKEEKTPTEDSKGGFVLGRGHRQKIEAQQQASAEASPKPSPVKSRSIPKHVITGFATKPSPVPVVANDNRGKISMDMSYFKPPPPPPPKIGSRI